MSHSSSSDVAKRGCPPIAPMLLQSCGFTLPQPLHGFSRFRVHFLKEVAVGAMSLPLATTVHKCPELLSQCPSCDVLAHFTASVGDLQHGSAPMSFSDIPQIPLFKRFFSADGRDCRVVSCTRLLSGYANSRHAQSWGEVPGGVLRDGAAPEHVRRHGSLVFFAPFGSLAELGLNKARRAGEVLCSPWIPVSSRTPLHWGISH